MYTVQGKVLERSSGHGIPHLIVECFDVGATTSVADLKMSGKNAREARRVGSAATDQQGSFKLTFALPSAATKRAGATRAKGPNLVLTVSPPDGSATSQTPLHISPGIRHNAGATETYVVHISEQALQRAGVPSPGTTAADNTPVEEVAKRLLENAKRDVAIASAVQVADKVKVDAALKISAGFDRDFRPALQQLLTAVTPAQAGSDTYVQNDAMLERVHQNVIETDLRSVINDRTQRSKVKSLIALTEGQRAAVRAALDSNGSISEDDLAKIAANATAPANTEYLRPDPLAVLCRELTDGEVHCADALGIPVSEDHDESSSGGGSSGGDSAGSNVELLEAGDVPRYLARVVDTMTSPEEGVVSGLEPRSSQSRIEDSMQQLEFAPSPADTTAVYHFHNLQVAFRHVWQEAVDEGVLTLAQAAYDEIVTAGGTPQLGGGVNPVRALMSSANAVVRARASMSGSAAKTTLASAAIPKLGTLGDISGMIDGLFGGGARPPAAPPDDPLPALLAEIQQRLQEPYAFTTFAANRKERSVNFGTLVTYEQEWKPLAYQAGKLAKTITLAPKEVRKFTKTVKRHRKRAEKEVENHLSIVKQETSQTTRAEQEIIRKANAKTNFQFSSESTAKDPTGMAEGTTKTAFEREASQVSESVKKTFHESVMKAAQEFKDELSIEVTTEEGESFEETESGEILNPNDELAVTFLFYELQRRYRVNERIHRITPVVLVAQEMPKPHEINEAWLLSHDWILRRVLLDDSFVPALTYLSTRVVGDQVALAEMRTNIAQQRAIITELKQQLTVVRTRIATYRNLLEKQLLQTAEKRSGGGGGMFSGIPIVGDAIDLAEDAIEAVGDFVNPDIPEVGQSRQDTLKEAIQRTVDEERDLLMRLEREVTALNALTETYSKALAENFNQRTQILRLRTHVKQNITYYMQAIWNHEPPDQRYLRLHETPVPTFQGRRRFVFPDLVPRPDAMVAMAHRTLGLAGFESQQVVACEVVPDFSRGTTKPLAQVADLDNLLGYFGNYMIFALKKSNPLTDFMMEPYIVRGFDELTDPDDLGNWSLDEFVEYVCCLRDRLSDEEFERVKPALKEQYERLIVAPRRNGDVVTIPTGSLFIEALPATASLMERFKAVHRMVDVKKAQAEARQAEIRNLWMVDRLLHGEREDPDIDKKVIIERGVDGPTLPVDDPT